MKPTEIELRELYEVRRLSLRDIGIRSGVCKHTVAVWLRQSGIPIRAVGRGLANRGVDPPSRDDLERMIRRDRLTYREISERYGVCPSAVMHWLVANDIRRPKVWETRDKKDGPLDTAEVARLHADGLPPWAIGEQLGWSEDVIRKVCKKLGLKIRPGGFKNGIRYTCADGSRVRSLYEKTVADWLLENRVAFAYEPKLPFDERPWDRRMRGDFLANGWYIEIWGVTKSEDYEESKRRKQRLYREHGLPLIELPSWIFAGSRRKSLEKRLRRALMPHAQSPPGST